MNTMQQAKAYAKATGSKSATIRVEVRNADGTLTVLEETTYTREPLTAADIDRALADERHLGFGYRSGRESASEGNRKISDAFVLKTAQVKGWDYEDLFAWANSKNGRWTADALYPYPDPETQANVLRWNLVTLPVGE